MIRGSISDRRRSLDVDMPESMCNLLGTPPVHKILFETVAGHTSLNVCDVTVTVVGRRLENARVVEGMAPYALFGKNLFDHLILLYDGPCQVLRLWRVDSNGP